MIIFVSIFLQENPHTEYGLTENIQVTLATCRHWLIRSEHTQHSFFMWPPVEDSGEWEGKCRENFQTESGASGTANQGLPRSDGGSHPAAGPVSACQGKVSKWFMFKLWWSMLKNKILNKHQGYHRVLNPNIVILFTQFRLLFVSCFFLVFLKESICHLALMLLLFLVLFQTTQPHRVSSSISAEEQEPVWRKKLKCVSVVFLF